jgi:hypothetical protein
MIAFCAATGKTRKSLGSGLYHSSQRRRFSMSILLQPVMFINGISMAAMSFMDMMVGSARPLPISEYLQAQSASISIVAAANATTATQ